MNPLYAMNVFAFNGISQTKYTSVKWKPECTSTSAMARCYQCGTQTDSYKDGSALCEPCDRKLAPRERERSIDQLNAALTQAREKYQVAIARRRAALEFKPSRDGAFERTRAIQQADDEVELAAMRFREALRDFAVGLKKHKGERIR